MFLLTCSLFPVPCSLPTQIISGIKADSYTSEVVVQRAISKLGEHKYDVVWNNCEHFAYYCKTGNYRSEQVNQAVARTEGLFGVVAISAGTKLVTKAATEVAKQSLNPISKALVNIGIKQAPSVAGRVAGSISGAGGLVSGIATDIVVNKMMEDDEHLPHKEREARKNARQAGKVASTIGGIAGTFAAVAIGGTAAVGAAVAAPAVLGLAAAITVYQFSKGDD
ncbi:lecithin retinol acyltransferase family protein [Nostoc sp. CMAA1605]|uniref:lecithin retinol acyltransferase family protein n=1 Tax=Nostoc sp. CMAA1605 TaxID=2055159 RepID=UPI001FA38E7C|nr:lecithin retinol acyltransferase family protein [Nostoc sp. CMAA1605]MCF4965647.1 NC domain protein [Nostoc sp. CMAA1605]